MFHSEYNSVRGVLASFSQNVVIVASGMGRSLPRNLAKAESSQKLISSNRAVHLKECHCPSGPCKSLSCSSVSGSETSSCIFISPVWGIRFWFRLCRVL